MRGLAAFSFYGLLAIETATALKSNAKLAVAVALRARRPESVCKQQLIDSVSVMDSSGSLYAHEWRQILTSTTQLIDAIDVGPDNSRIAPISFGTWAHTHWYLDDARAQDAESAKKAVMDLPFLREGTNTPQGLSNAYEVLMRVKTTDPARFNNKQLTRLIFVATDGCSNFYDTTKYKSKDEHLKTVLAQLDSLPNVVMLLVGIGSNLCPDEIRQIAGCPPLACNFVPCPNAKFTDFEHIFDEIPKYLEEICEGVDDIGGGEGGGDNGNVNGDGEDEKSEGGSNAALIAGVLGGLALIGGVGGGAYAYSAHGSGPTQAHEEFDSEDQSRDEGLADREAVVEADGSMFA